MSEPEILVVGLGITGWSIARFLARQGRRFAAFDTRTQLDAPDAFHKAFPDAALYLGNLPDSVRDSVTQCIVSPGLDLHHPVLQALQQRGIVLQGDIELFAQHNTKPVIAITGTNGKSTVTTLVGELLNQAGIRAAVAGNIGLAALDALADDAQYDAYVLELSSFQLELTHSLTPKAATILNISPDHLDRHGTLAAYQAAKQRVYHHAEFAVYSRDDKVTMPAMPVGICQSFGLDAPLGQDFGIREFEGQAYLCFGEEPFLACNDLGISGKHNWANALAATAIARYFGVSFESIRKTLAGFKGLEHRTVLVRTLHDISWINDSKGTNVGATVSALQGLGQANPKGKLVLIAGGVGKGADFSDLRPALERYARALVLIGRDREDIAKACPDSVKMSRAESLEEAIAQAQQFAKAHDMVLFSPACASFDMFRDYKHRGECFEQAVRALQG